MNKLIKKRITNSTKKGFTLVELVIVIAVIAILAGVSVAAYFGIQKEAKEKALLAEATDAYNEYRINQILNNNDDSLNESSLIEGVYYSKNYDEYILFKDNTTYNLGSYIKESNEFSNTNRFAIDYDNDGLPVIIDLDNSVEGIESKTYGGSYYATLVDDYLGEDFRIAVSDYISAYNIFETSNSEEYGSINNYSPFFYFEFNNYDKSSTTFDDTLTYSLSSKYDYDFEYMYYSYYDKGNSEYYDSSNPVPVPNEAVIYSDKLVQKGIKNKSPYFLIAPQGSLLLPNIFNGIKVTDIYSLIFGDQWSYMRDVSKIIIPEGYYTMSTPWSLAPNLGGFMNEYGGYYWDTKFFFSSLENIIVEAENFTFDKSLNLPVNYQNILEDGKYGINIIFNSNTTNSYRSLLNASENIKRNNDGTFSFYSEDRSQFFYGKEQFVANIIVDGYSVSEGTLKEVLNRDDISFVNIFDNYLTDVDCSSLKVTLPIENLPKNKTLFLAATYNSSEKEYNSNNSGYKTSKIYEILEEESGLKVSLNGDTLIEGTLKIGGVLNQSGVGVQGLISGDYATLDLNGHTLTIKDGGYLESYGNIIDSVGGGKIVVEKGGKILNPFVVTDFNGGTVTVGRYNSNMSPFNSYMMPYLNADIEILNGGTLLGNCVLYAGGNHNETQIKFIGNTSDSLIQTLNDSSKVNLSKSGSLEDLSSYYEVIDLEGEFNINAMNLEFITYNIKTNKVPFPVSQYLSINVKNNSIIHLNQLLKVMYGSKINVDQNSTLIFEDVESSNSLQSGIFVYPSFNNNSIKYSNSNDVSKANGNILGLSYYEEENSSSYIDIQGNIIFKGNNHIFAGKFDNITNFERDIVNNLDNIEISSYSLYEGGDYQNSSKDWVKGEINYRNGSSAANYYSLPLIINDKAYIKGSDNSLIEGSFDLNKGTFKENNSSNTYIFIFVNNDFKFGYELFKDNVEMYFSYNSKGSFIKVDEILNNDIYKINNKEYVYYLGAFVEGSSTNDNNTFTFINNKFKYNPLKEDLTEEITLTYSSTDKRRNQ